MSDSGAPRVLSTFTGAGGLALGLETAGFSIMGCVEMDPIARETLKENRDNWPLLKPTNIVDLAKDFCPKHLGIKPGELDLLSGGPPCQTFSKAAQWSKNGRKGLEDHDCETALDAFLILIQRFRPKAVLIENVPGFVRGKTNAIPYLRNFFESLREADEPVRYQLDHRIENAAHYGVPQRRKRALFVALRESTGFCWPDPTHLDEPIRAWDALADIEPSNPPAARGKWAELLPSIPEGKNYQWHTEKGEGRQLFGYRTRFWSFLLKLAKDEPSWTLQAQPGPATGPFHWDNRPLATKEMLRLQSFPSNWLVSGERREQVRQIGNATPPLLGEVFGRALRRHVDGCEITEPLRLALYRKDSVPAPHSTLRVPKAYLDLEDDHPAHPGPGKGPDPVLTSE